jgi:hypothetical protein
VGKGRQNEDGLLTSFCHDCFESSTAQLDFKFSAWHRKSFPRQIDKLVPLAKPFFQGRQYLRPERFLIRAVHQQFHHCFIPLKVGNGRGRNGFAKLFLDCLRISVTSERVVKGSVL